MQSPQQQSLRARRQQVLQQHMDGENFKDMDAMIASFHHPHYTVIPMASVSDGEAAVRALIGGVVDSFPDFHFEPLVTHHADSAVIVEGRMTGPRRRNGQAFRRAVRRWISRSPAFSTSTAISS